MRTKLLTFGKTDMAGAAKRKFKISDIDLNKFDIWFGLKELHYFLCECIRVALAHASVDNEYFHSDTSLFIVNLQ